MATTTKRRSKKKVANLNQGDKVWYKVGRGYAPGYFQGYADEDHTRVVIVTDKSQKTIFRDADKIKLEVA